MSGTGSGDAREQHPSREPRFQVSRWTGALIVMAVLGAALLAVQIANAANDYSFNRFGLRPRRVDGLWGVLTQPGLHRGYGHLLTDEIPFLALGWLILLSGIRVWLLVTAI